MIEPVQSGAALLTDIQTAKLNPGEVGIWWLGQSGYAIKTASKLWYVDLYLSEHLTAKYANTEKPHIRMTRAPIRGDELTDVKWVFASHKHSDHLDPETIPQVFQNNPAAKLVFPLALVEHVKSLGLTDSQMMPTRGDETLHLDGLTVHAIPSAHPGFEYSEGYGYPFLGFVFQVDGITIYHSGDTLVYDGLAECLKQYPSDIAFLPINGTSERLSALKVPPNMNIDEALELATNMGKPLVIPHHYDMFTFNTADVGMFVQKATSAGQPHRVLQCGEKFIWRK